MPFCFVELSEHQQEVYRIPIIRSIELLKHQFPKPDRFHQSFFSLSPAITVERSRRSILLRPRQPSNLRLKERMTKQWGAMLSGHDHDLQDWQEMLKPGDDPWVEVYGSDTVLRSNSLGDLDISN